jgi:hypothetical protein
MRLQIENCKRGDRGLKQPGHSVRCFSGSLPAVTIRGGQSRSGLVRGKVRHANRGNSRFARLGESVLVRAEEGELPIFAGPDRPRQPRDFTFSRTQSRKERIRSAS